MANKIYSVVKDGEELEQLKTLAAAKKLADEEGAEVYADGQCVYQGVREPASEDTTAEEKVEVVAEKPAETKSVRKGNTSGLYRLKALMNVREKLDGKILKTLPENTIVDVSAIEDDWLHLKDGTYILFNGGEFAERV